MPDSRFHHRTGPYTLAELSSATGATLSDPAKADMLIQDVAPLDKAGPKDVSFLDNPKYVSQFSATKAAACFVHPKHTGRAAKNTVLLLTEQPYTSYALAAQKFYPEIPAEPVIHPTAIIGKNVSIGARCDIGPYTVIHDGVVIGDDCRIGAQCSISHAIIGSRVVMHRGVHIGQDGFGFAPGPHGVVKVPQLGRVVIEDDVEIGSGTCIDRGGGPDTFIGQHSKIDNLVQVGHNVYIGRYVMIAGQTGIAGSTRVEDGAMIGGQVGLMGHHTVGRGAKIAAQSGVMHDVPPGAAYGGYPAGPIRDWHRQTATLAKLAGKKGSNHE